MNKYLLPNTEIDNNVHTGNTTYKNASEI